jgi:hypothetical protein
MKNEDAVRSSQVNQHCVKTAASILQHRFIQQNMRVEFVQEPWTVKDRGPGDSNHSERPKAALLNDQLLPLFRIFH